MKTIESKNGETQRVKKLSIEFTPNNDYGIAGVTLLFDGPVDGKNFVQYLPGSVEFETVIRKIRWRKAIGEMLAISYPKRKIEDHKPTQEWLDFQEMLERQKNETED